MIKRYVAKKMLGALHRLQPWDLEYLDHLSAEWNVLQISEQEPDAKRFNALTSSCKDSRERKSINRGALLELEQTLLTRMNGNRLIQLAPILRMRYHDIVGDRQYTTLAPVKLQDCKPQDTAFVETLRSELLNLVGHIHWRYVLAPFRDKERVALTVSALIWVAVYTIIWIVTLLVAINNFEAYFLANFLTVLYSGIVGGFISALRRMQSINEDSDSVFVIQSIAGADFWLWFSPLLGGVFAVVAYLFFVSGLVSGVIFPAFRAPHDLTLVFDHHHLWFWGQLVPRTQEDYGKLFLWCFIAGFAERFVPDMIDKVIQRSESEQAAPLRVTGLLTPTPIIPSSSAIPANRDQKQVETADNTQSTDSQTDDASVTSTGAADEVTSQVPDGAQGASKSPADQLPANTSDQSVSAASASATTSPEEKTADKPGSAESTRDAIGC